MQILVPCVAGKAVWHDSRAQQGLGDQFLEPELHGVSSGPRSARHSEQPIIHRCCWTGKDSARDLVIVGFAQMQIDILREKCYGQFVTHNLMGYSEKVDYFHLGESLDFASHDQYPMGYWMSAEEKAPSALASTLDLIRAVKGEKFLDSGAAGRTHGR